MIDTIVVVPAYNEAKRLPAEACLAYVERDPRTKLLFVNDGSTDGTRALIEGLARARPGAIEAHTLDQNSGKAEAVRQGLRAAFAESPKYVGYWDADLATPLPVIEIERDLLERRPELWMVLGSRVRLLGRSIERSAGRHLAGRLFATFASLSIPLSVYDTQCGAKLLRVCDPIVRAFDEPFSSRWIFDVELLARLRQTAGSPDALASRLYELPLTEWRDVSGTRLKPSDFPRAMVDLARIYAKYR